MRSQPVRSIRLKHNPAVYYIAMRQQCAVDDIPLESHLSQDIAMGNLPSLAFVTPNLCDDTHDCSVQTGDTWLATWIPRIVAGPNYSSGNTLIVLTWDEGVGTSNLIPTMVIGPSVPTGTRSTAALTHYSLLLSTEELLGLPAIGAATTATSMTSAFRL
ncbi:MAG TPA: alkaline phosphatase family protein [Acidothermaceae bacterium]